MFPFRRKFCGGEVSKNSMKYFPRKRKILNTFSTVAAGANVISRLAVLFSLCRKPNRPLKRYPYFPLPENIDAIVYHPTPDMVPAGRKNIEAPAPNRGGGLDM